MISVPSDIMARFQVSMDQKPVPIQHQPYYKKWFRFYWDFCHKYHHPVSKNKSLIFFVEKLRHKKQKDYQIRQASDAVYLYYGIVKKRTLIADPTEKRSNADQADPMEYTRFPDRVVMASAPQDNNRSTSIYRDIGQDTDRKTD